MAKKYNIDVGVEIEGCFNKELTGSMACDYHNPVKLITGWRVKTDGSIHNTSKYQGEDVEREIVSDACTIEYFLSTRLKQFKQFFNPDNDKELDEIMYFNNTTGTHIHFSINGKQISFRNRIPFEVMINTRQMFLKLIGESSVLSLKARNAITKSYNRPYAALIEEDIMTGLLTKYHSPDASRRMEWNFNSEMNGTGLEWRSPNMREISTWKEFDEFFIILAKCVKYFVENALTYSIEKEKDYVVSVPNCNIQKGIFYFDETKSKRPDTMFYQHNYDDIMVVNIATKTRTRKTVSF